MSLIPSRSKSKKQKAAQAASKAGKKVTQTKAVQKAPKTAAAVWTGKRSGKILRGVALAIVGVVTLKAIRKKRSGGAGDDNPVADMPSAVPAGGPVSAPTSAMPDPGAPTATVNGSAPAAGVDDVPTPPQGDALLSDEPTDK